MKKTFDQEALELFKQEFGTEPSYIFYGKKRSFFPDPKRYDITNFIFLDFLFILYIPLELIHLIDLLFSRHVLLGFDESKIYVLRVKKIHNQIKRKKQKIYEKETITAHNHPGVNKWLKIHSTTFQRPLYFKINSYNSKFKNQRNNWDELLKDKNIRAG